MELDSVQGSTEAYYVIKELSKNNEVHLFSRSDPGFEGVNYHHHSGDLPALFGINFLKIPSLIKHLRETNTDVLYTYRSIHIGAYIAAQAANCCWVVDLQTPPTSQDREVSEHTEKLSALRAHYLDAMDRCYQATLPQADGVITLSEGIKSELVGKYDVASENITLVPLGVNLEQFDPDRYESSTPTPPYDCVYLGSIAKFRGLDMIFEGIAAKDTLQDDLRIHIIGDGPVDTIQSLQQQTVKLGISDMIQWHGLVDHEKVPQKLAEMDIALSPLPALDSFEVSSPAKLFEYLAMGLPVVCSDITPHRNVLTEGVTGFFYPPDDKYGFASALGEAVSSISSNNAKQEVRQHGEKHGWRERVQKIDLTLNQVCQS